MLAKHALYQLSYGPIRVRYELVRQGWLAEPKLAANVARLRPLGFGAAAFARCASVGW